MSYGDDNSYIQQYLQGLYNVDPNKDNSAQNDFYGYQNGNSYNGQTYGSAYAGGTNGSAYGGWTASNPLSGNNAFSGNQGSGGYGPDRNTGYDPRVGMKDGGSHNTDGSGASGWNLSAPMQEVGGMPADPTSGGTIPTNGAMGPMRPGGQMPQAPGAMQSPYSPQIATNGYGPQDTPTPADRLITNSIGGQSSISAYDSRNGGRPFAINDEDYQSPSNTQQGYDQKMASMQDYMKSHGVGYFGDPQKDYGYSGNSLVPNTGGGMPNSMEIPTATARDNNGQSDWDQQFSINQRNAPPIAFNPQAPSAPPFGGIQAPPTAQTNADYQTYQQHGHPFNYTPEQYASHQAQHNAAPSAAGGPDTPSSGKDPTNDPANWQGTGKHSRYVGPDTTSMHNEALPKEATVSDLQQQRKGLQMQPGQTLAPFSGTPVSSNFSAQDPNKMIASNFDPGTANIFDQTSTPYKPGKSQADPVLDGLLQQLQTTHDPATINKIMKMINPSGSKSSNLKGMA